MSSTTSAEPSVAQEVKTPAPSPTAPDAVVFRGDGEPRAPELMLARMQQFQADTGFEADEFSRGGTVEELERRFADVLGTEASIFMPTGTLANHLAIRRHCGIRPRAIVQEQSHLYNDTGDSLAQLSGINLVPLGAGRPAFSMEELQEALERAETGRVSNPIGVVMIESPVRRQAGQIVPYEQILAMTRLCRERGIPIHLDGARLFMMSAATGIRPREYAGLFDTAYVSLYKYFGAPFGAILAGTSDFISGLYHDRRMFGSGLPSSALVAGLTIQGLDGFEERFAGAMTKAKDLFAMLNGVPGITVQPFEHGSNIFPLLAPDIDPSRLASGLAERSIFLYPDEDHPGRILLHVNTTVLRRSNEEILGAFRESLE